MEKILDLHIHSKYSRACSKELELPKIARACEIKGIDICVTGDFTHPAWFKHIKENLIEDSGGVYKLRDNSSKTRFIIGTEIASIKKHNGQTRRLHLLVFAPNIEVAEKFNKKINDRGINLKADGRPILGMTAKDILELMLEIDSRMVMIPAHAWTPWFGVFGSKGGYDSLDDCFEDLTAHIFAIETGLSSDPLMNRRLSILDDITLVSNSDAHSLPKLGKEANVLNFKNANSEEVDPKTAYPVIHIMPNQKEYLAKKQYGGTIRLGAWPCKLVAGTHIAKAYGNKTDVSERHRHRYEFNNEYRKQFEAAGMAIGGASPDNQLVEAVEITGHPFFIGTQFHPEYKSRPLEPHPLFVEFIKVCANKK